MDLINQAQQIYNLNFPKETCFERAVFFSWGCSIADCQFCYMSTQPKDKPLKETKRSKASLLAEFILCKHLGWDIGFFTGGIGIYSPDEMEDLLKDINKITKKPWLSIGPIPRPLLERFKPYIKGVVGSTETINPKLHNKVCPSKPLVPYEQMFIDAKNMGLKCAMTFIVGLGETKDDLPLLTDFIKKYNIDKIHVYGLIPHKDTAFENTPVPSDEYQAWWIANLRIKFPKLDIQLGIWEDRIERTSLLLKAGANSISKLRALKIFGTNKAKEIEHQAKLADREFKGTLTKLPDMDWDKEVDELDIDKELKTQVKEKLISYIDKIQKT